jgi:hypothetical protein
MIAALVTLNPAAQAALALCEQRIERGLRGFLDAGQALIEIRDSRLYRGTHETFEAYIHERWQMGRAHAYRMIAAAEVVSPMGDIEGPAPTNERQARELAKVPEAERADVWREAVERTDGKPTAKVVEQVAKERTAPQTPEPPAASPTAPVAGSGSTSPDPEIRPAAAESVPSAEHPPESDASRQLKEDIARESERRTAVASIRSVLTYLTSRVLSPEQVAQQYRIALSEYSAEELRFAAKTMAALAALKEQ